MARVSVIVPVYNASRTLRRCVDSILKQDFRDFEVILVDDGSRDDSVRIAVDYEISDPRVRSLTKENGGVSSARNMGLDAATGEWVAFADSDDWLPMDAIKLLVRETEAQETDMVIGDFYRVFEGKISLKGGIDRGGKISRDKYAEAMMKAPADLYFGVLWNKLYRRDLIEKYHVRMDESVNYGEDVIFNLEYLLHVKDIAVLKAPVYYYIRTPGSLIEQHVSLNGIVTMKRNVVRYYDSFYKQIFDERTYQERRAVILSIYLAVSTDSLVLPWSSGAKSLGKERDADVPFAPEMDNSVSAQYYLGKQLASRYLETIGVKHDLTLDEMRILYLLWCLKKPVTMEDIGIYLDLGRVSVTMLTMRLISAGFVMRGTRADGKKKEGFVIAGNELDTEFEQLENDYRELCFEDISEEDRQTYLRVSEKIRGNIRRRIARTDAGAEKRKTKRADKKRANAQAKETAE